MVLCRIRSKTYNMISLRYAGAAAALFVRTNALFCSSASYVSNNSPPLGFQQQRQRPIPRRHGSSSGSNLGSTTTTSSSDHKSSNDRTIEAPCPLPFTELPYRGACLTLSDTDNSELDDDDNKLISLLTLSIPILTTHRYNSCWVRIPIARSSIAALLASQLDF